jgi:hypothetical protein
MFKIILALVIAFVLPPARSIFSAPALRPATPPQSPVPPQDAQIEWSRHYLSGYSPEYDYPFAIAVDSAGNAHVTGGSWGPDMLPDIATIQYSTTGVTQWARRYNGRGDSWDQGKAIALDASGNVYVTGETYSAQTDFDYVTIKYDPSGMQRWVATYDGPGSSEDSAVAIAVDTTGSVYVTGYSGGSGTFYDYATVKYDSLGQQQWVARFNGAGNTKDIASGLALDGSGNIYVTGSSGEGSNNLSDYVTVKYDPSGVQQWVGRYTNLYDYARAIAVDASGNAYVTGSSYGSGTYYDYATVKYTSTGMQSWVARYHGPGGSDDNAYAVKVDASGNVYVTGESVGPGTSTDYATLKYSAAGVQQWVRRYDGPGNTVDGAVALVIDNSGRIHVTGGSRGSNLVDDFATVTYSTAGEELRVVRYHGEGDTYDLATAIGVDAQGSVYVTGYSSQLGMRLFSTIKLVK